MGRCIHLIDDARAGGVLTNLNTMISTELNSSNRQEMRRFKTLYQLSACLVDRVIAVSEPQAEWYRTMSKVEVTVIPPMTPLGALLELPPKKPARRLVVGVSGRLNKTKGIDLALGMLESETAQSFDFLFAGYGELTPEVTRAADEHRNVSFMGPYKDPQEFLKQCDLVMIPSRLDTYGLAALEARAAGKPIVVTQTCGLTEQANGCGIAVEQNCAKSLAKALKSLVTNHQLAELAHKARASAFNHNLHATQRWVSELSGT